MDKRNYQDEEESSKVRQHYKNMRKYQTVEYYDTMMKKWKYQVR